MIRFNHILNTWESNYAYSTREANEWWPITASQARGLVDDGFVIGDAVAV